MTSRFKDMSIEELDNEISRVQYIYQKALMMDAIKKVKKDYIPKYLRERSDKNDRKSKSKPSR